MNNKKRLKYLAASALVLAVVLPQSAVRAAPNENSVYQENSRNEASISEVSRHSDESSFPEVSEQLTSHTSQTSEHSEPIHVSVPTQSSVPSYSSVPTYSSVPSYSSVPYYHSVPSYSSVPEVSSQSSECVSETHESEPERPDMPESSHGGVYYVTDNSSSAPESWESSEISEYVPSEVYEESSEAEHRNTDALGSYDEVDDDKRTSQDWEKLRSSIEDSKTKQTSGVLKNEGTAAPFEDMKNDKGGGNDDWIFLVSAIAAVSVGAAIIAAVIITTVISKKRLKKFRK